MFSCLFHISELHEDSPNIIAHDAHGTLYCAIQCLATKDLRVVLKKIAASGLEILEHGALAIPHHSSLAVVLEASNVVGAIAQFLLPEEKTHPQSLILSSHSAHEAFYLWLTSHQMV